MLQKSTITSNALITNEEAKIFYEDMFLGRIFEDTCAKMYYQGKMFGFVHLYTGQEAVSTGIIKNLKPYDYVCSNYRDHVHALSKGIPPKELMAELFGKETGCSKGRGGSMHIFSSKYNFLGGFAFIAEGIPIALGAAFRNIYQKQILHKIDDLPVSICFIGDGATNNGQFFECLNMASLWKLPIIFVVENNQWAIGMANQRASSVQEIYKKADAFNIPGVEVDGMNILEVIKISREAIARARSGQGPTLIEALTYRFRGHSLADPDELRSIEEKNFWIARDPIINFVNYIKNHNLISDDEIKKIEKKVKLRIEEAVKFAIDSPEPNLHDLSKYLFY
ncbi:[pt] pyruvate dehydrogenase E1 component subunit alpha [Galdieria sulphuraria]|uniref:Pyruvate dehydrogenase E1 component subunit alpha n=1 Tax=Galdieria sulphuraria TaxID=130081 RepID=M2VYX4_GALSU|nr:pyruvate dehydrogenase E1 component alpha subunit [Galdieria sulphuraria]XP_005705026.1 [pt] pyruvate dehydrogenase E1 component subunit alpha [Galdieria sulphuraria]AIG92541.1 pyruvate dehydrogenase E1 component alpha subunit [Galdieria sulphuraria]EME28506.1 [pt] pyruvate dehydrogenase E1 component subunit alpha [Galdieria sulphuraria]|eukprot:XP_005705026.1 [pt] pyruvate dehydrogenase E1 component subunit alpha [Galdieria sulphuraria]